MKEKKVFFAHVGHIYSIYCSSGKAVKALYNIPAGSAKLLRME
jgi:hypothetical protein